MTPDDVPSPIDLRDPHAARTWADEADLKRPWRTQLRASIAELVKAHGAARVLELGSGPGLLAEAILATCRPVTHYTLLDFSPPMLSSSRDRVGDHAAAELVLGDFKQPGWTRALPVLPYDAVVTMQAVHELRHKRHAATLYAEVRDVLRPGGLLVVCDHEPMDATPRATALHATEAEQHAALRRAGYVDVRTVVHTHGMYVCCARRVA